MLGQLPPNAIAFFGVAVTAEASASKANDSRKIFLRIIVCSKCVREADQHRRVITPNDESNPRCSDLSAGAMTHMRKCLRDCGAERFCAISATIAQ